MADFDSLKNHGYLSTRVENNFFSLSEYFVQITDAIKKRITIFFLT